MMTLQLNAEFRMAYGARGVSRSFRRKAQGLKEKKLVGVT